MTVNYNFNQSPYFDDYSDSKDFYRILFKPAYAVQARELTQLQTLLSQQIERFGDNILQEGTIVKGCNFTYIPRMAYVKILDLQTDGQPVVMSNYTALRAVGLSSGVEAYIVTVKTGLESQQPDLNTLYLRYVKSNGANKTFSSTENIRLENFDTGATVTTVTAAGTVTGESSTAIGNGVAIRVGDGIIYQKGFFVRVEEQLTIVEKYSVSPNAVSIGFVTSETITTSDNDTSLLDNAEGYNNANAPGADRLTLTPILSVKTVSAANLDEDFFTLVEYRNGLPVRRKEKTQYSVIGEELARRTEEESGDYVIRNFPLSIEAGANSNVLKARIGSGLAYVAGNRVETYGPVDIDIDAGTETSSIDAQNITTNIGYYVIVDELRGNIKFNELETVSLYDNPQNAATANTAFLAGSANGTSIGTAKVRGVEYHSGTIGTPSCQYKVYLFDIRMSNTSFTFANTQSIIFDGTNDGSCDTVLEASKAVIKDFSFKKTFWEIGHPSISTIPSSTTDFVYRTVNESLTVSTGGTCNITLTGNQEWTYGASATLNTTQKKELILICNETQSPYVKGDIIDLTSATVTTNPTGKVLSIHNLDNPASTMDVIAYYNVKKLQAAPAEKQTKTVYIKIDANTNPGLDTGTYSLGLPDVYEISGVYQSSNGTYAEDETDVTSSFILYPNQRDTYYDLSYVKKKRSLTIGSDDVLLFKVKVFQENNSGSFSDGYFSVDSYTDIDPQNIPVYKSETGVEYDLRDCVDFRPYCANTVVYSTTIVSANVANSAVGEQISFASGEKFTVAPNENMEIDYSYYLPRIDRLIVDSKGQFKIIKGVAESNPTPPSAPSTGMTLATINIPAYPSLTSLVANRANKPTYATKMVPTTVIKGYTMKDIGELERRIERIEYYTVLNALEQSAKNKSILDASGNDRFKNGIFTDSFEDLSIADVKSSEFSAAIDPAYKEMIPKIREFDIDLKVANVSNVTDFGKVASLSKTDVTLIDQPYATSIRNAVSDFYKYNGTTLISPTYDAGYDVTTSPDFNLEIDLTQPFVDFVENLSQFVPLQQVGRNVVVNRQSVFDPLTNIRTTSVTTSRTIRELQAGFDSSFNTSVGDFVRDIRFNPFMKSREIKIYISGMRPSTTLYAFFDGKDISSHIAPATYTGSDTDDVDNFTRTGEYGDAISSDSTGIVRAIFRIPSETFFVGDRQLEIMDVSTYSSKTSAISYSSTVYSAFNFAVDKGSIQTRFPDISVNSTTATNVRTIRTFEAPVWIEPDNDSGQGGAGDDGGDDPIAQTFYIRPTMAKNDNVVFATKIDLYFQSVSDSNGFTVYLKEVENGVITSRTLPFSKVHINASDAVANTTAAQATTVTFKSPIPLQINKEYAFVIRPDGNDPGYNVWVAKTGETDVTISTKITQDVNDGVLFTSTNDRTWTPYQDENIKYTLYCANFSSASGYINMTNKDSEYFSVNSISGTFKSDEYVFVNTAVISAQTVSMTAGNTTIEGVGTTFTTYFDVGDHIVLNANSTKYDVLEIQSITNNTVMVTKDVPKFTNSAATFFKSIVGTVSLIDTNEPARLFLDNSTADASAYFQANDTIIGADSRAIATIESVDNKNISFIAPNIYRTNSTQTKTKMTGNVMTTNAGSTYTINNIEFNNYTFFNTNTTVIKSKSNEAADGDSDRSFVLGINLENTSGFTPRYSSPIIDTEIASIKVFEYIINNDNTDEDSAFGAADTKYISKVTTLADGLDAEDIKVYLTAYRPPGTTIEVYGRFLAATDPEDINSKPWTLLDSSASNPYSQNSNRFDFKEHEFNLPTTASVSGAAFLNSDDTFEYSYGTATFNDYKYFQLKIVLLADSHSIVPRVADIRSIALSV